MVASFYLHRYIPFMLQLTMPGEHRARLIKLVSVEYFMFYSNVYVMNEWMLQAELLLLLPFLPF